MTLAILVLSFIAALLMVFAIGSVMLSGFAEISAAHKQHDGKNRSSLNPWLAALCRGVASLHKGPAWAQRDQELTARLMQAGRPLGNVSGLEFLALSEIIGVVLATTTILIIAALGGIGLVGVTMALAFGAISAWMVHAWLAGEIETRRGKILLQYPFFLDLAVMTMEEGSSLSESLQIYCRDNPDDALAEEFRLVLQEMQLGKMAEEAFANMKERVASEEVRQSITGVIQGQRMDSPLGEVFREQAEGMRFKRSQMAERMAEELKVKVMGPVVLMMIAILILILGPAFLGIADSGIVS